MTSHGGGRAVGTALATLLALLAALLVPSRAAAAPALPSTSGWPLAGAVQVLNGFDPPDSPWGRGHRGVDLTARVGARVLAAAAGQVTYAGMLAGRGVVVVSHGSLRTTYEPVAAVVSVGDQVRVGQPIGRLTSGSHCRAGPCLHWGLRQEDTYLDPLLLTSGQPPRATGEVLLLPAAARAVARQRAAERAVAAAAARAFSGDAGSEPGPVGASGFVQPVRGAITSGFGRRFHPVLKVWKLHDGTDIAAPCGSPIRAASSGVVSRVSAHPAYGRRLFLEHDGVGEHQVTTSYNHASGYVVGVGARVSRGQLIGQVGSTGYSTGCHLHLMVWVDDRLTDPAGWL
jgi:murein DD-endopeptidase MepM/ murein hydrolase activator NlpD